MYVPYTNLGSLHIIFSNINIAMLVSSPDLFLFMVAEST